MSELKHTPGPWYAIDSSHIDNDRRIGSIDIITEKEYVSIAKWLAHVSPFGDRNKNFPDHEEAIANAKLIAAAPDLLAASQAAIALADNNLDQFNGVRTPECQAVYDQVKAAIDKATK